MEKKNKIVLIGCGNVGMSYCYALLNQKTKIDELRLIDLDSNRIEGEVMDLNHGLPFGPSKFLIKAGKYEDCKDASIIVLCAGANQKPGETRLNLLEKNYVIFKEIITRVMVNNFDGIFVVATNPVDIMTYITYKLSGLTPEKIMGSGTTLDTARLRYRLSEKISINAKNIHAYVIGEHGDSEMIPWSVANLGLEKLTQFLSVEEQKEIAEEVRTDAYKIINKKGSTHYGIGMCLVRITNAILGNENSILTVSSYDKTNDIYIGMPTIVNRRGAVGRVGLNLIDSEKYELANSVKIVKETIDKLNMSSNKIEIEILD